MRLNATDEAVCKALMLNRPACCCLLFYCCLLLLLLLSA
jgi:hypothetical protein